jgi:hypothetical protein
MKTVFSLRGLVLAASERAAWGVGKSLQMYTFFATDVVCFLGIL